MADFDSHTRQAAYFQAGQAVVASLEGISIVQLSIVAEGDAEAWIDVIEPNLPDKGQLRDHQNRAACESLIRALLAGPAAQERYSFGACADQLDLLDDAISEQPCIWRAVDLAGRIQSRVPIPPPIWREVCKNFERPEIWAAVQAVGDALFDCGELAGCEVTEIAQHAMRMASRAG
jgi:hypothetical protein